jgi:hypothetical protein
MNTRKIASDFGLRVTHTTNKNIDKVAKKFELKKPDLLENAFIISDEDIVLGIYKNREFKQAAFFHEIGHTLVTEQYEKLVNYDEMLIEFQAWVEGLKIAKKYGHHFSDKAFKYMLKAINSYYKHALSVYNTKK